METSKLTVRLPTKDLQFAKEYAKNHGISLTELIDRYFEHLRPVLKIITLYEPSPSAWIYNRNRIK